MSIEILTPRDTAEYLRRRGMSTSEETIRKGLDQHVFPFGDVVQTGKAPVYYIYKALLDKWVEDRATSKEK